MQVLRMKMNGIALAFKESESDTEGKELKLGNMW